MKLSMVLPAAVLALTACQKPAAESPSPARAQPQASAPAQPSGVVSDFSQPMTARGTEPFWAVRIEGTRFTLQRPDQPDLAAEAPGAQITPGKAYWEARAADGRTLKVTLYVSECSDGMSDLRYPMRAEVELAGETLHGCAAKTAGGGQAGGGGRESPP